MDRHGTANRHDDVSVQIDLHRDLAKTYVEKRYAPAFSRRYQQHWNRTLCAASRLPAGSRVLDLGCGTGILFRDLVEHGFNVVGIDVSCDMLNAAYDGNCDIGRICADGCRLPLPDAALDGVFCRGAIHHIHDLHVVFGEIARVLKPGGVFVFSEPCDDAVQNRLARALMYSFSRSFHEDDKGFRRRRILPKLHRAGFEVRYSRGFGFLAYTFAGFPDKLGILNRLPGSDGLTRLLIRLDTLLESVPVIEPLALHWMVSAVKR